MINKISISNFKCFENIVIPMKKITALAGINAVGKSTVIQSLLLIRQTVDMMKKYNDGVHSITSMRVPLNGAYCLQLGTSEDIINTNMAEEMIVLTIDDNKVLHEFAYKANKNLHDLTLQFQNSGKGIDVYGNSAIYNNEFYYLNTERVGPRLYHEMVEQDFANCGYRGEFTGYVVSEQSGTQVEINKRSVSETNTVYTLEKQIEYWLDFIIPGTQFRINPIVKMNLVGIEMKRLSSGTDFISPYNLGFGISYILPIIVSGLIAKPGSVFVVENPEVHLHPSGQSRMGEFLAQMAASGVQVIMETHSEHIINGIRLAALKNIIDASDVQIDFFSVNQTSRCIEVESIELNEYAEITKWPKGFLDQEQTDLNSLIKLKREKKGINEKLVKPTY